MQFIEGSTHNVKLYMLPKWYCLISCSNPSVAFGAFFPAALQEGCLVWLLAINKTCRCAALFCTLQMQCCLFCCRVRSHGLCTGDACSSASHQLLFRSPVLHRHGCPDNLPGSLLGKSPSFLSPCMTTLTAESGSFNPTSPHTLSPCELPLPLPV